MNEGYSTRGISMICVFRVKKAASVVFRQTFWTRLCLTFVLRLTAVWSDDKRNGWQVGPQMSEKKSRNEVKGERRAGFAAR